MNEHGQERIADAFNRLRPDWPVKQLRTLLADPRMVDRPRRDVTVALAWVACESASASPYRVLEAGPWWRAAAVDGAMAKRTPFDAATHCGVCSEERERCRMLWAADHEFEPARMARARKGQVDLAPVVAELKGHLARTAPASPARPVVHTPQGDAAREALGAVAGEGS